MQQNGRKNLFIFGGHSKGICLLVFQLIGVSFPPHFPNWLLFKNIDRWIDYIYLHFLDVCDNILYGWILLHIFKFSMKWCGREWKCWQLVQNYCSLCFDIYIWYACDNLLSSRHLKGKPPWIHIFLSSPFYQHIWWRKELHGPCCFP